jgi:cell division protein FtsQ
MNIKRTITKIVFALFWIVVGGGLLTLLIAANKNKRKNVCTGHRITIKGNSFFADQPTVLKLLSTATGGTIEDRPLSAFNLRELEELLEHNVWIEDAELWFDNREVLHVSVTERSPIARVITTVGNSFYIDPSHVRMPLSEKISARVPVFTSFPDKKILGAKDSVLLKEIGQTSRFIMSDPFWMSQVAQIDITTEKDFEMIPVVGDHMVKLGKGRDIEKKFKRLFIFYDQVLSKTGFDHYSVIDVQYAGQVTGTRRGTGKTHVDPVQLKRSVDNLLKQSRLAEMQAINMTIEKPPIKEDLLTAPQPNSVNLDGNNSNPNAVKTTPVPQKPKAIMKPKTQENANN